MAEVFGVILDGVGELHDGGHLLHGEVGDGAEVAAVEALGGLGEGGVGLDAELFDGLGLGDRRGLFGGFVCRRALRAVGFIMTVLLPICVFSRRVGSGQRCQAGEDLVQGADRDVDVLAGEDVWG